MSRPFGHPNNITILSDIVKRIFNVVFLMTILCNGLPRDRQHIRTCLYNPKMGRMWTSKYLQHVWGTIAGEVEVAAAEHARGGTTERLRRRAKRFLANFKYTYDIDGSVIVDVSTSFNSKTIAALKADDATFVRVDPHWLVHVSLDIMSWLLSSDCNVAHPCGNLTQG